MSVLTQEQFNSIKQSPRNCSVTDIEDLCDAYEGLVAELAEKEELRFALNQRNQIITELSRADAELEKVRAEPQETRMPILKKNQPCGCIVCTCEGDRCSGCGAKHCGTHPIAQIPNPVYERHALLERAESKNIQLVAQVAATRTLLYAHTIAPSGVPICACNNRNAAQAGLEQRCWYCEVRAVLTNLPAEAEKLVRVVEQAKIGHYEKANGHCNCGLCVALRDLRGGE